MKAILPFFVGLLWLNFHSTAVLAQHRAEHAHLKAEVYEFFDHIAEVFRSGSAEDHANRFLPNGSIKLPQNDLVKGHEALTGFYTNTMQLDNFSLELEPLDVNVSLAGDMAWVVANYKVSFNQPGGGVFSDDGVSLVVLQRKDGQWKIAAENLSSGPRPVE